MSYQLNIFCRVVNATLGAYGLATLMSIAIVPLLSSLFAIPLADAVYFSLLLAYFIFFAIVIVSFSTGSVKRLYIGMAGLSAVCVLAIYGGQLA